MELFYDGRWVFESGYDDRHIPKNAGFQWDSKEKQWWTPDIERARSLDKYASASTRQIMDAIEKEIADEVTASQSTEGSITVPAPKGKKYMPFQIAGIQYASHRESTLLSDEMGLGKTIQAIGVINLNPKIQNVLILCPASLKINWKREMESWLVKDFTINIVDAKRQFPQPLGPSIFIINFDILKKFSKELREQHYDVMVVDECHYLKNAKTQRAKQIFGNRRGGLPAIAAKKKLFLTGTPIVNRPSELFAIANFLAPDTFGNFWGFMKRYANATRGTYGWDMSGASNLEELQQKLRASIMVRRLKKDVLTELPPKIRQVIELPANGISSAVRNETQLRKTQTSKIRQLKIKVQTAKKNKDENGYRQAMKDLRQGYLFTFSEMARARHDTAIAKTPTVIAHTLEVLNEDPEKKVVVFGHHHDVIDGIAQGMHDEGIQSITLTGRESQKEKQNAIDTFQTDPRCKVFIGSIQAAGVGLTLTESSHVIFAELDWVPGNVSQAEDRCHRIGQTDSVLIQHLVLEGSIDAQMARKVIFKQEVIDKALDIKPEEATSPVTPIEEEYNLEEDGNWWEI